MANAEVAVSRDKMRKAASDADRVKYRDITQKQRTLFADALRLKQQDMTGNRKNITEKLEQFAATMQ